MNNNVIKPTSRIVNGVKEFLYIREIDCYALASGHIGPIHPDTPSYYLAPDSPRHNQGVNIKDTTPYKDL